MGLKTRRFLSGRELAAAIIVAVIVCLGIGGWSAFKADDNNLLQGIDTEQERQKALVQRQNELVSVFLLSGIPPALIAGLAVALVLRQLRLAKTTDDALESSEVVE